MPSETSPKPARKPRKTAETTPVVEEAAASAVEESPEKAPKTKPRKAKTAAAAAEEAVPDIAAPAKKPRKTAAKKVADTPEAIKAVSEPAAEEPVPTPPTVVAAADAVAIVAPAKKTATKKKQAVAEEEPAVEAGPAPKLERVQKILAKAGISSRRKAEELILGGLVQINGQLVTELGTKADPGRDHIRVDGKLLQGSERIRYFVLNKPKGYVTTVSDPEGRPTVMQFFEREPERLYPVGRLDYLSEGLLLVTNDGELANKLTKAASGVEKTYLVKVAGQPTEEALETLRAGVVIEKGRPGTGSGRVRTAPAQIRQVREGDNPWYEVIVIEGRNRELRKMFEEIGHHVEKIRRIGYGPLILDQEPGKLRELEPEEVEQLKLAADGKLKTRRRRGPAPAQLSREAGKTVRFKKADGRPGYEKPGFKNKGRAPEPPVTDYVLPPRKPGNDFDEDAKPAFNPDYKPGFRTGGKPLDRPGFSKPGFAARPARPASGPRPFGNPNAERGGFSPAAGRGPGAGKPFRPQAPTPEADLGPSEPRLPIRIEPVQDRREERPRAGRPAPGKPFRAYPGGPATGDRAPRPPFRPSADGPGAGRPAFNRPAAGSKPFRPRTDGPPGPQRNDRPFRPRPAADGERGPGRPMSSGAPARPFRPAGESRPFTDRPGRPTGSFRPGGPGRPPAGDRPFRPGGDRPSFGRPSGSRPGGFKPGGAKPGGMRPSGAGEFRPGPPARPFRPAGPARPDRPGRPDGPPRFAPRADAPPARRSKPFGGAAPREFSPRPPKRFDAPPSAPGGSNSKPSGKLGPDGQPRIKVSHRDSFVGKNKGRPKPKGKKDE